MELGTKIYTPRFCTVKISAIFEDKSDAVKCGYTEPTYAEIDGWDIRGKSLDMYHMKFCAIKK